MICIRAYLTNERRYVVRSLSDPRIVIADFDRRAVIASIPIAEDAGDGFDFSPSHGLLAVGYWSTKAVQVWHVASGKLLWQMPLSEVTDVRFDRTCEHVVVRSCRGSRVVRWASGEEVRIRHCERLAGAVLRPGDNTMLVPLDRERGRAMHVSFDPLKLTEFRFPTSGQVWRKCLRPGDRSLITLADTGEVSCYRDMTLTPAWTTVLARSDISSLANFCGDGSLLCVCPTNESRSIVLEPEGGQVVRLLTARLNPSSTFTGTTIMTAQGHVVDLASNTIEEGCSSWRWWRAAGA